MQVDPRAVFSLLGSDGGKVFPVVTDCPLCGSQHKLEVRSPFHVVCRSCWFIGDLISLYAAHNNLTISGSISTLIAQSALSMSDQEKTAYLDTASKQLAIRRYCADQIERTKKNGLSGAALSIFANLNVRTYDAVISQLAPHAFYTVAKSLEGVVAIPKESKPVMTWWGRYGAIAIPSYDGVNITGLWLVNNNGEHYLPLFPSTFSAGFSLATSISHPATFVVDSAAAALRYSIWSILSEGTLLPFVVPYGVQHNIEDYRSRATIYWSTRGDAAWTFRAMQTPGAQSICTLEDCLRPMEQFPARGSAAAFVSRSVKTADQAHVAAAQALLHMPETMARALVSSTTLAANDRARCLASVSGEDAARLEQIFGAVQGQQAVAWNGDIVTESSEGWSVKGKLISAAKLCVYEIRPIGKTGDAEVSGAIVYQSKSYNYTARLNEIMQNPGAWMQRMIVASAGRVPFIDRGWTHRLFELAQQFHAPNAVLADNRYGWHGDVLRMPHFIIDRNGVYPSEQRISGPSVLFPDPLSASEVDMLNRDGVCRLVMALLGNIAKTRSQHVPSGILLINEPQMLQRYATGTGQEVAFNPTFARVETGALDPLPLPTNWTSEPLRELFSGQGPKNIITSVDRKVGAISRLYPDWLRIRVGCAFDPRVLRVVFLLTQAVIARGTPNPGDSFYRELYDSVREFIADIAPQNKCEAAARDLDLHSQSSGSQASRLVELLAFAAQHENLAVQRADESVTIRHTDVGAALATPFIPLPAFRDMTAWLMDAKYLLPSKPGAWCILRDVWDLHVSLSSVR